MPEGSSAPYRKADEKPRVAVIGSGAAGLAACRALGEACRVHLFEAAPRLGGHCHTVTVDTVDGGAPVDTGFIVFNPVNYPNLTRAFAEMGVETRESEMSFSVSCATGKGGRFEYSGRFPGGLFAQPANLLRPQFWRMLADIRRFYRTAADEAGALASAGVPLGDWLAVRGYSRTFCDMHLLPMAGAIWSQPAGEVTAMPAATLIRFFEAHGLLRVAGRPQWRTVVGGSRRYVETILEAFPGTVHLATPVARVLRDETGVYLRTADGRRWAFDHVVIAAHADQAFALLDDPCRRERDVLGAFGYRCNRVVLHRDPALMPGRRAAWASWNYIAPEGVNGPQGVTYWMNRLQGLATKENIFVTLNPPVEPVTARTIGEYEYTHPVFDTRAVAAQSQLGRLQGLRRTWYCGSYFGNGFHEDAFASGLRAAAALLEALAHETEHPQRRRT